MAAAYPTSTAPISSRSAPDWRNASHLSRACCASRTASRARTSVVAGGVTASAGKDATVADCRLDPVEGRIAHEDAERHHDRARSHALGALCEAGVTDDHLSVGRDRIDREVLDRHVVLLQPL